MPPPGWTNHTAKVTNPNVRKNKYRANEVSSILLKQTLLLDPTKKESGILTIYNWVIWVVFCWFISQHTRDSAAFLKPQVKNFKRKAQEKRSLRWNHKRLSTAGFRRDKSKRIGKWTSQKVLLDCNQEYAQPRLTQVLVGCCFKILAASHHIPLYRPHFVVRKIF